MEYPGFCDVLIVDDEPDIREGVSLLLKTAGYLVKSAAGAEEALQILSERSASLVLCDISMPAVSGLDLLSHLRADGKAQAFVMLTAHSETERITRAMRLGAIDYVVKPFNREDLLKKCATWVDLGRRMTELAAVEGTETNSKFDQVRFIHRVRARLDRKNAK